MNVMSAIGMIIVPILVNELPFLKNFPCKDTIMMTFGCACSMAFYSFFALSDTDSVVYAAGAFMLFAQLFLPGFRSFFSKIVGQEETARILATMGILEKFTTTVAAIIFTKIYNWSLDFDFPALAFVISAAFHIPIFIGMILMHIVMIKEVQEAEENKDKDVGG